jgi:hypothetical protein
MKYPPYVAMLIRPVVSARAIAAALAISASLGSKHATLQHDRHLRVNAGSLFISQTGNVLCSVTPSTARYSAKFDGRSRQAKGQKKGNQYRLNGFLITTVA